MSHVVTIQTKVRDRTAVVAACGRLGIAAPTEGTAKLFQGEFQGLLVQLPGWNYPVVLDLASGDVRYDNFEGAWGDVRDLHRFLQIYAVEKTKIEGRRQGYSVREQALADGSIRLQLVA